MDWIFFALGVVVVGVVGIAVGLFIAGRLSGWAERRGGKADSAFMTPVGPPPGPEAAGMDGGHGPSEPAGIDAVPGPDEPGGDRGGAADGGAAHA
jgi:hypothetical protein